MKSFFLTLVALYGIKILAVCQSVLPQNTNRLEAIIKQKVYVLFDSLQAKPDVVSALKRNGLRGMSNKNIEGLDSLVRLIGELNKIPAVSFFGNVGANQLETFRNSHIGVSAFVRLRITNHKLGINVFNNKLLLDPRYIYIGFSTRTGLSEDSSSIRKAFIFPELNKTDFIFGYYRTFSANNWEIRFPYLEFSINKYLSKTKDDYFTSETYKACIGITKSFPAQNNIYVSAIPYLSAIHVDKKYNLSYFSILKEDNLPSTFRSMGIEIILGLPSASFFCNMNYILNKEDLKSPEFVRFVYTIGVKMTAGLTILQL